MEKKSHKKQYIFIILIYLIIFIPLVFLRYPDARNELKYFVITEDMIKAKNYLILTRQAPTVFLDINIF